jgi:hypothetical protein
MLSGLATTEHLGQLSHEMLLGPCPAVQRACRPSWFVGVVAGMCNCVLHSSVMIRTPSLHNEGLAVWITVCCVSVVAAKVLPVTWMVCHGAHKFKLK